MQRIYCNTTDHRLHTGRTGKKALTAFLLGMASLMVGSHGGIGIPAGAGVPIHTPDGQFSPSSSVLPVETFAKVDGSDETLGGLFLTDEDAERYRLILSLQSRHQNDEADREIARLKDRRLVGTILAERYLQPGHKTAYADLADWLDRYADNAEADRVHALAIARQPAGRSAPRSPKGRVARLAGSLEDTAGYRPEADDGTVAPQSYAVTPRSRTAPNASTEARMEAALRAARPSVALAETASADAAETGSDGQRARGLSARWAAGLAAWKGKRFDEAGRQFEALVAARPDDPWMMAAAAFWAARVAKRHNDDDTAKRHLSEAALYPHTFYGLVASRSLGNTPRLDWNMPAPSVDHLKALAAFPAGRRAIGLLQIGRRESAERELLRIDPKGDHQVEQALLAIADRAGLPSLALSLGNAVLRADGAPFDSALYPLPHWQPRDGFAIDRALVFAVMRQESRFDTRLISGGGASGLMQILPETAIHIGERNADLPATGDRTDLFNPATNMEMGQRYLNELLNSSEINGNLIMALAAYNAGPGHAQRWQRDLDRIKDPFVFIESLPYAETRQYVEKVLANYWLYRLHLGLDTQTLDTIVADRWPRLRAAVTQTAQLGP